MAGEGQVVAGPETVSEEMSDELRRFSSLEIRFHLITPGNFESLREEFLSGPGAGINHPLPPNGPVPE